MDGMYAENAGAFFCRNACKIVLPRLVTAQRGEWLEMT
jgi:hypothetical protein